MFGERWSSYFDLAPLSRVPWRAGGDAELHRQVVATTDAATREFEPVAEDASAFVVRVVGQQPVQPVLLLAPATVPAVHLLALMPAQRSEAGRDAAHLLD